MFFARFLPRCRTVKVSRCGPGDKKSASKKSSPGNIGCTAIRQVGPLERLVEFESAKGPQTPAKWQDGRQGSDENGQTDSREEPVTKQFVG